MVVLSMVYRRHFDPWVECDGCLTVMRRSQAVLMFNVWICDLCSETYQFKP